MSKQKTLEDVIDSQTERRDEIRRMVNEARDNLNIARAELRAAQNRLREQSP